MDTALTPFVVEHEGNAYPLWKGNEGTPRALDLDVGRWLEFDQPHSIRKLIRRYEGDLGSIFSTVEKIPGRGRPGMTFYLTEDQVLFLVARSETPKATQILKLMIAVFQAALRGGSDPDLAAGLDELRDVVAEEIDRRLDPLVKMHAEQLGVMREMCGTMRALAESAGRPVRRERKTAGQMTIEELLQVVRPVPVPEQYMTVIELAERMRCSAHAMRARLDRPAWLWLRELGDKYRWGRGRRWLWSEVEAAMRARRPGQKWAVC